MRLARARSSRCLPRRCAAWPRPPPNGPSTPTRKRSPPKPSAVREKITKGIYQYAPAKFTFDVKNGTLRFAPAVLASHGAETKVNAYLELASLKLDSEWAVSLAGAGNSDVPPVSLVFTGTLNKARRNLARRRYRGDRGLSHHAPHAGGRRASGDTRRERPRPDRRSRSGREQTSAIPEQTSSRKWISRRPRRLPAEPEPLPSAG